VRQRHKNCSQEGQTGGHCADLLGKKTADEVLGVTALRDKKLCLLFGFLVFDANLRALPRAREYPMVKLQASAQHGHLALPLSLAQLTQQLYLIPRQGEWHLFALSDLGHLLAPAAAPVLVSRVGLPA